jgi:plastocyanin domain-containing protein
MIWVNLFGVLLIFLIAWWIWFYQPRSVSGSDGNLVIKVHDGVYQPAHIKLKPGKAVTLYFLRKDASPCAAVVEFPDFGISKELPVGKRTAVRLPALLPGEYPFHCQMNMYQGSLIVS